MTLLRARMLARKYSDKYNTQWHVKKMLDGSYEPYAYCSEQECVAIFYCGTEQKQETAGVKQF